MSLVWVAGSSALCLCLDVLLIPVKGQTSCEGHVPAVWHHLPTSYCVQHLVVHSAKKMSSGHACRVLDLETRQVAQRQRTHMLLHAAYVLF